MEIRRMWLRHFKGLETVIDPASIVVLFGANDSGKSNVLEAIWRLLTWSTDYRTDPLRVAGYEELAGLDMAVRLDDDSFARFLLSDPETGERLPEFRRHISVGGPGSHVTIRAAPTPQFFVDLHR